VRISILFHLHHLVRDAPDGPQTARMRSMVCAIDFF
jgi:hypothetical protein